MTDATKTVVLGISVKAAEKITTALKNNKDEISMALKAEINEQLGKKVEKESKPAPKKANPFIEKAESGLGGV